MSLMKALDKNDAQQVDFIRRFFRCTINRAFVIYSKIMENNQGPIILSKEYFKNLGYKNALFELHNKRKFYKDGETLTPETVLIIRKMINKYRVENNLPEIEWSSLLPIQ